ncbi:MAG: hypothetical protein J6B89_01705 [Bacilli bacterium]|nr:hypothetical protein [Bacilli bacterium]
MKRKTEILISRIGKTTLLVGAGVLSIWGLKSCHDGKVEKEEYSYSGNFDLGVTNQDSMVDYGISSSSAITSLEDAMNMGLLSNVSRDELENTINSNPNIDSNVRDYLLKYVDNIYSNFPDFNNAVLNKNFSLLTVKEISRQEMADRKGNNYTDALFNPVEHTLYYVSGSNMDLYMDHEISHMVNEVVFDVDGQLVNLQFSDNGYGQGLEENICTFFTNIVSSNTNSYHDDYLYLLNDVVGSKVIWNSFLTGNVYDFQNALQSIDYNIDSTRFIEYMDQEVLNPSIDNKNYIYNMIGEYFIANETNNLNSVGYIEYLPTYIEHCSNFQAKLVDFDVDESIINTFKENRYDRLAEATRACYGSSKSDDTVILRSDPNGINAILSNVCGSDLAIYNYTENQYGVDYISYITLKNDDPSDGLLDLLSGELVFPDNIYNSESGDYYIENEGINEQKRLSVIYR